MALSLSKRARFLIALGGLLVPLSLILLTAYLTAPSVMIRRELARIRAAGEPLTPEEFEALRPPVADSENAAILLEQVFRMREANFEAEPKDWIVGVRADKPREVEPDWEKLEKVLALNGTALDLTREALTRPKCRFGSGYESRTRTGGVGGIILLLEAERELCLHLGQPAGALQALRDMLALADLTQEEVEVWPVLAVRKAAMSLSRMAGAPVVPDDVRKDYIARFSRIDISAAATRSLIALRATWHKGFEEGQMDKLLQVTPQDCLQRGLPRPDIRRHHAGLLAAYTGMVNASRLPPWEAIPESTRLATMVDNILWCYAGMFITGDYVFHVRVLARRDAAILGLSCELFRSGRGRYPGKLEELAPEFVEAVPPDPFTGKPFVYRLRERRPREGEDGGKAFVVYSVGENLTDDGGVSDPNEGKDDIAWEGRSVRGEE